jgi:integral membrane sensor domain MASE1
MQLALFALACLAAAELGQVVLLHGGVAMVPVAWLPAGLLVGVLLLTPPSRWIGWVVTAFVVMTLDPFVVHSQSIAAALLRATVPCVEAVAVAWAVRRFSGPHFTLNRLTHAVALLGAALLVPVVAALLSATLSLGSPLPYADAARAWWLADALGILLAAPLVIALARDHRAIVDGWRSWRSLEALIAFGGVALVTHAIFAGWFIPLLRVPAYLLPFLIWPALRFGPSGSALCIFVMSVVGIWNTSLGLGPFARPDSSVDDLLLRAQGSIVMLAFSVNLLASVVTERHDALVEIKTLRGLIPICAWCHKVRDDADVWQRLEGYLASHTDATFSHSICPSCSATQHEIADATPAQEWRI